MKGRKEITCQKYLYWQSTILEPGTQTASKVGNLPMGTIGSVLEASFLTRMLKMRFANGMPLSVPGGLKFKDLSIHLKYGLNRITSVSYITLRNTTEIGFTRNCTI